MRSPSLLNTLLVATSLCATYGARAQNCGTTFHVGFMENYQVGALRYLELSLSSQFQVNGSVQQPQTGLNIPFAITPGTSTVITVPSNMEPLGSDTIEQKGLYVTGNAPLSVQALNYTDYSVDATRVLPLSTLGCEYTVMANPGFAVNAGLYSEFVIVGTADSTQVTITPTVTTLGGHPANIPFTVTLNAHELYQVKAADEAYDLTGTTIVSTNNWGTCALAVFGGAVCSAVPTGCPACDHLYEQQLPTDVWGEEYHTVAFQGPSSYTVRVLAQEDSTTVAIDGASTLLNAGETWELNASTASMHILSDKPICVAQLLEGVTCTGLGDPSLLLLHPRSQGVTSALFSTGTTPLFGGFWLGLSTDTANTGLLELDGLPIPDSLFLPYATDPGIAHVNLELSQGVHSLTAPLPFLAHAYGLGSGESYALSVGGFIVGTPELDTVICSLGGVVTLQAPAGFVDPYWWAPGAPNDTLAVGNQFTLMANGDTTLVVSDGGGTNCESTFAYNIELPLQGVPVISAGPQPHCANAGTGLSVALVPPALFSVYWSPTGVMAVTDVPSTTAYTGSDLWVMATVTSPGGCWPVSDSVLLEVLPNQLIDLRASTQLDSVCAGTQFGATADPLTSVAEDQFIGGLGAPWDSLYGGAVNMSCMPLDGQALVFDGAGTRGAILGPIDLQGSARVRFALLVGNGLNGCDDAEPGENIHFDFSFTNGFNWASVTTFTESAFGSWTLLEVQLPQAAMGQDILLRWRQNGALFSAGEDIWALDNVLVMTEGPGVNYSWQPAAAFSDASIANPNVTLNGSTWLHVTASDSLAFCPVVDSVFVNVGAPIAVQLPNDTVVCGPGSLSVQATPVEPDWSYDWTVTNASISNVNVPDPSITYFGTGTYIVQASDLFGCTASDTMVLYSNLSPQAFSLAEVNGEICGGSLGPWTFQWYLNGQAIPGQTDQCVPFTSTGQYTLVLDAGNGCSVAGTGYFVYTSIRVVEEPPFVAFSTSDGIHIQVRATTTEVRVCDAIGKDVAFAGVRLERGDELIIPIQAAGTYVVHGSFSNGSFAARVVAE